MPYGRKTDVTVVLVEMHTFKKNKHQQLKKKVCKIVYVSRCVGQISCEGV